MTIEEKYTKIIDKFIPEKNKEDIDLYFQSFLLVSAHIFSIFFIALFIWIHYSIDNLPEVYALLITALIFIISFTFYPKSGNNVLFGNFIIFGGFLGFFLIAIYSGGVYAPVIPWFTALSVTGFLFANKISGYFWTILTLLTIVVFFTLDVYGFKFPIITDSYTNVVNFGTSYFGSAGYLILIVLSYEYLNNKKNIRLNNLLNDNLEKQEELQQQHEEIRATLDELSRKNILIEENNKELEKLSIVVSETDNSIMIMDKNGDFEWVNSAFTRKTGLTLDELIKKRGKNILEANDFSKDIVDSLDTIIKNKQSTSFIKKIIGKDGLTYYSQTSLSPILDDNNEVKNIISIRTDISELIEKENMILQQQEELQATLDEISEKNALIEANNIELEKLSIVASETNNSIVIMDKTGKFEWVNKAFTNKYGLTLDSLKEVLGENIIEATKSIDLTEIVKEVTAKKTSIIYETKERNKEGEDIYTQTNLTAVLDENNEVRNLVAVNSDISAIKEKEAVIMQNNEEIIQQQEELQVTLDELSKVNTIIEEHSKELEKLSIVASETDNSIVIMDKKGNFEWVNKAFTNKYGLTLDGLKEVLGENIIEATKSIDLTEIVKEVTDKKTSIIYETKEKNKEGEDIYTQTNLTAVLDENNEVRNLVAVNSDISAIKEKEAVIMQNNEEIIQQQEELQATLDEISEKNKLIEENNKELEKLSIVASETDNSIVIMDKKGNFEWVNKAFTNKYGLTLDGLKEVLGENIIEATKSIDLNEIVKEVTAKKTSIIYETKEKNKEGEDIYTQTNLTAVLDENNEVRNLVAVNSDISAIKEKEAVIMQNNEEIIQQQEELQATLEEISEKNTLIEKNNIELEKLSIVASKTDNAIVIMDKAGNFEWINKAFTNKYGLTLDGLKEMLGKNIIEATKSIDITEIVNKVITNKTSIKYESKEIDIKGKEIFTQTNLTAILDSNNEVRNLVAINSDISEIKEKEFVILERNEEITQQQEELQATLDELSKVNSIIEEHSKELEKLSIVASETDNSIMIMDKHGNFEWVNSAFTRKTGLNLNDLIQKKGKNILEANNYSIDIIKSLDIVIKQKQSTSFIKELVNSKGETYHNQTSLSPILDDNNEIKKIISIRTDISELIEKENMILQQQEELKNQRDTVLLQKDEIEEMYQLVNNSIDYATRIQRSILPEGKLLEKHYDDYFVLFKPRDKVSGDFYWWANIEGQTVIAVADCTGHGVPGAFMSMLGVSFLREIVLKEYITHPGVILRRMRKEIIKALKQKGEAGEQKDGMDLALISIDNETNEIQFAGAQNPLYIITDNVLEDVDNERIILIDNEKLNVKSSKLFYEIKPDKMPIAIYEKMDKFKMHKVQLQKNDQLFIFSDGFVDQFGGHSLEARQAGGKKFKSIPFKRLMLEIADKPMSEKQQILDDTYKAWKGELNQIDDVCIVGIKI